MHPAGAYFCCGKLLRKGVPYLPGMAVPSGDIFTLPHTAGEYSHFSCRHSVTDLQGSAVSGSVGGRLGRCSRLFGQCGASEAVTKRESAEGTENLYYSGDRLLRHKGVTRRCSFVLVRRPALPGRQLQPAPSACVSGRRPTLPGSSRPALPRLRVTESRISQEALIGVRRRDAPRRNGTCPV